MNPSATVPPEFADILAEAGMADWDWAGLLSGKELPLDAQQKLRHLARSRRRNFALRAFIAALIPDQWVRYGDDELLVSPRDNFTGYVVWLMGRSPEPASVAALTSTVIEEPCLILDVGANCGTYAVPLARHAAAGSTVLAFEPNPIMADRLRQTVARNGLNEQITVHESAISEKQGEALLYLTGTNYGEASLNGRRRSADNSFKVKMAPMLDFIDPAEKRQIILKMDIEGHEDRALIPYLSMAPSHLVPRVMLIETRHRNKWRDGLGQLLKDLSYQAMFEAEGNTLFVRG